MQYCDLFGNVTGFYARFVETTDELSVADLRDYPEVVDTYETALASVRSLEYDKDARDIRIDMAKGIFRPSTISIYMTTYETKLAVFFYKPLKQRKLIYHWLLHYQRTQQ